MISKIGPASKSTRALADYPSLLRSAIGFTTRTITAWRSRHTAPLAEVPIAPEPAPKLSLDEILAQLGGDQLVLRKVRCQFGTIEHVVLSKAHGILLLDTKTHAGRVAVVDAKIRINGSLPDEDFVAEALHTTYWLVEELRTLTGADAAVTPFIVFTEATMEESRQLKGITITSNPHLHQAVMENSAPMLPEVWALREKIAGLLTSPASR